MSDPQPTGAPAAGGSAPGTGPGVGIEETARLAGLYRWCELQLFEVTGLGAVGVRQPTAKVMLGTHSSLHAWHADLWAERLPELRDTGPERLTRPVDEALAAFAAALAAPDGPDAAVDTIGVVVGVYRVFVPRLATAYRTHLGVVDRRTDAPTARTLTLALRDTLEQWHDGEQLLQLLLRTPDDVRRAADRQADLEARWVSSQGLARTDSSNRV